MTTIRHSIPLDLIIEILLKLPTNSVLRFKSVSKSWCSIIRSKQFIDAFMSLSRPRFVLMLNDSKEDQILFFSSPHPSVSSSSRLVPQKNILTMPKFKFLFDYIGNPVRGFLVCDVMDGFVVCNPTTGQVIHLGQKNSDYHFYMHLGYDPNSDQYKVLRLMSKAGSHIEHSVCTLGGQISSHSWRPIKTSITYEDCYHNSVCIDGVVYFEYYYIKLQNHPKSLGTFNVGSEQLSLIEIPEYVLGYLTNYLGKLGLYSNIGNRFILWVLDDAKNQVWSKITHVFSSFPNSMFSTDSTLAVTSFHFAGITAVGEFVYVPYLVLDSFELLFYNVEKKIERRVRVQGILKSGCLYPYPLFFSYVDNIIYM